MHLLLVVLLRLPAILMFHQVDTHVPPDRVGRELTISPAQLSDELRFLQAHRLRAVSVEDFL
ncbi:MAG TPA: hypothetical protein VFN49_01310, partial [Candidatus Aquilonibacter sp.]|nr:hypothetical protein [Candidatus Aquilonibacter sp.]